MWEAQQETMTQHETMTQTACFRRPAAETPADLGQVTGERLSLRACVLMFSLAACMSSLRQAVLSIPTVSASMRPNSGSSLWRKSASVQKLKHYLSDDQVFFCGTTAARGPDLGSLSLIFFWETLKCIVQGHHHFPFDPSILVKPGSGSTHCDLG